MCWSDLRATPELFVVAAVDLVGDAPEPELAARLRTVSDWLEGQHDVSHCVLTLSVPEDATLT